MLLREKRRKYLYHPEIWLRSFWSFISRKHETAALGRHSCLCSSSLLHFDVTVIDSKAETNGHPYILSVFTKWEMIIENLSKVLARLFWVWLYKLTIYYLIIDTDGLAHVKFVRMSSGIFSFIRNMNSSHIQLTHQGII